MMPNPRIGQKAAVVIQRWRKRRIIIEVFIGIRTGFGGVVACPGGIRCLLKRLFADLPRTTKPELCLYRVAFIELCKRGLKRSEIDARGLLPDDPHLLTPRFSLGVD